MLKIEGTETMRTIPSIYEFSVSTILLKFVSILHFVKSNTHTPLEIIVAFIELQNLKEAKLTHSFHCCAFKYPEQHDPERHAKFEKTMRKTCEEYEKLQSGQITRRKRAAQIHSDIDSYPR